MSTAQKAVFITGPTASGKSAFVHRLIDAYFPQAHILSADSIQIYQRLNKGTAKPSPEEQKRYRYHAVDYVDPRKDYSLAEYLAHASDILKTLSTPVFIVGGTGLYVRGLKHGLFDEVDDDGKTRETLERQAEREGLNALYTMLQTKDPESAERIPPSNKRRIIRALEVCIKTGTPFSQMQTRRKPAVPLDYLHFNINLPRETLYERINARVLSMVGAGLIEEVRELAAGGLSPEHNAMKAIGYKEVFPYLHGKIDKETLTTRIQQHTRHYAKRQITWFKNEDCETLPHEAFESVAKKIKSLYNEKNEAHTDTPRSRT